MQLLREGKIRHRLQHVIQCAYGVPLDGVLGHVRDEDEQHVTVQCADAAGGLHAVEVLHLHIQKNNIVDRPIFFQNFHTVGEHRHLDLGVVLAHIALHIAHQLVADSGLILDDGDADHCSSVSQRSSTAAMT